MIAIDTNGCVAQCAEGRASWAIPWPCLHEFFSIVTHPRIYNPPTPAVRFAALRVVNPLARR